MRQLHRGLHLGQAQLHSVSGCQRSGRIEEDLPRITRRCP